MPATPKIPTIGALGMGRRGIEQGVVTFAAAGGGGAFSPTDITGLVAWYDASDTATITESGGLVSQWDDKSGNGNHLTQGTGAFQPITGTRTLNGLNVLDFDGSDDKMSSNASTSNTALTYVFVGEMDSVARAGLIGSSNTGGVAWEIAGASGKQEFLYVNVAAVGLSSTGVTVSTPFMAVATRADGAGWAFYLDGIADGSGTSAQTLTAGRTMWIGNADGNAFVFNGKIGEIITYDSVLGGTDLADLHAYVSPKWGTP